MDDKANTPQPAQGRTFLQRFAPAIAILFVLAIVIASIVGTMRVLEREAAKPPVVPAQLLDLPGPKNQISERTKYQIETMAAENPNVVGALVIRYKYTKTENMFLHTWAATPQARKVMDGIMAGINAQQTPETGKSSDDVALENTKDPAREGRRLRNSEEARMGLIKCIPIADATLIYTELITIATGICFATIPPFAANASMAIVMLTDTKLTEYSELAEMRRILLALQIDIYNRDFQGRETWAHP